MEPNYEDTIRRLGSEINGSGQSSGNTGSNTLVTRGSNMQSFMPKLDKKYLYAVIPVSVLIVISVWSPNILHTDIPPLDGDHQHSSKLNKVRLVLCTVVVSVALIAGIYMYNAKRKSV